MQQASPDSPRLAVDATAPAALSRTASTRAGNPRRDRDEQVFLDDMIRSICSRAHAYMHAGVPVHLRGPAGIGKTTLAHHIAGLFGRPVSLLTGDHWLSKSDMVGREIGSNQHLVRDTYIQSVKRTEKRSRVAWQDSVLTEAMDRGHTLIYDEFTRASPQANNTLLSVLEERVLVITHPSRESQLVEAHPDFRMIVTSNPDDYVGVNLAPDALLDRMVTFDLSEVSAETEAGIVHSRTGLAADRARTVVDLVRLLREKPGSAYPPSMRTAILIGRLLAAQGGDPSPQNGRFVQICLDVLSARAKPGANAADRMEHMTAIKDAVSALSVQAATRTEPAQ